MIASTRKPRTDLPAIAVDIGNSCTSIATWHKGELKTPLSIPTGDEQALGTAVDAHLDAIPGRSPGAVVVGSVVPAALQHLVKLVDHRFDQRTLVIGDTIPLPLSVAVEDRAALGVDRVCAAAAAYDKLQAACTIVDFGTAITVDLVDDEGTFLGGAILPGAKMQLQALHAYTAALPEVEPVIPESAYGRNTAEAMQNGVCRGIAGAVRGLVESYASHLNRWPHVVATGGDLRMLAPSCDFLDSLADHLVLRGIGLALSNYLEAAGA